MSRCSFPLNVLSLHCAAAKVINKRCQTPFQLFWLQKKVIYVVGHPQCMIVEIIQKENHRIEFVRTHINQSLSESALQVETL